MNRSNKDSVLIHHFFLSEHCPETRIEIANQHRKCQNKTVEVKKEKPKRKLFAESGRPFSFNEPKLEFRFEDSKDKFELDLHVHKWVKYSFKIKSIN